MSNSFTVPKKEFSQSIRELNLNNTTIGGEKSLPFIHSELNSTNNQKIAVEILTKIPSNFSSLLREVWDVQINDPVKWAILASEHGADILTIRFNIADSDNLSSEIKKSVDIFEKIQDSVNLPLIILGSGNKEIDSDLLPALVNTAKKECTFGIVEEDNYKEIVPVLKQENHNVIARTPIDINLAKELNILISELGFDPDKILIDPNMGALGYGLDYAYSVIERIRLAALSGDNMLNMPIITFVGIESWKAKESKSTNVAEEWGDLTRRAITWECVTASSMLVAGANIVVLYHPESIRYIKSFIRKAHSEN